MNIYNLPEYIRANFCILPVYRGNNYVYLCIIVVDRMELRFYNVYKSSIGEWAPVQERMITMPLMKRMLVIAATAAAAIAMLVISASACTMVYVGGELTEDGSTYLARSEDYSNSYNKIAYVSEHGRHAEGGVYEGCYGFTHTFTHDSYAYTATRDDNLSGVCPDCGQTHDHTPMEENGTNEKGVSVSAMVTLGWKGSDYFKPVDPMVSGGMCESDMTTILLGEAATAKEGVALLLKIYDTVGAEERSGVLIADQSEAWYVENYTGHQYIAVKLSGSMIAISPNMGAIGLVDLDDTENVIASEKIIEVAKAAGTYVGSEEDNTIDFRASYSNTNINARMVNGLNYLLGEEKFTAENTTSDDFTISNVKDGEIVTMYTPIETDREITTADVVDFYKVDGIGNTGNLEWHIFQIRSDDPMETGTIQWLAMENGQFTVAIPYFPVLTTDMYEGYKVGGLGRASFVTELPEDVHGYYPYNNRGTDGYRILPEGWEAGYYWSVDALSNYALYGSCSPETLETIHALIADMQEECYKAAAEMDAKLPGMDADAAKAYATETSAALAKKAHKLTLALYDYAVADGGAFFEDVDGAEYYTPAILWASCGNVVAGVSETSFAPDESCTRAQFVALLWRLAGRPEPGEDVECSFEDVDADEYYYKAMLWAKEKGIVYGVDDTHFVPNAAVSRAEAVAFLYRYAGKPETEGENPFTDVAAGQYYEKAVVWAVENGIVYGVSDTAFAPSGNCTRGQIAAILYRATVNAK